MPQGPFHTMDGVARPSETGGASWGHTVTGARGSDEKQSTDHFDRGVERASNHGARRRRRPWHPRIMRM